MIDLDANATTRLAPEVLDAMLPWLTEGYANPSGGYTAAKRSRTAIDQARVQVSDLIGCLPEELSFSGSGTESINTAIYSMDRLAGEGTALSSAVEHSAVLRCIKSLPRKVSLVPVGHDGVLKLSDLEDKIKDAAFVSLMLANNETGVLQPISQVCAIAHTRGIPVHTDAVQAAGKIKVNVKEIGCDMLSISAHKFHGPRGIGALFVKSGLDFSPLLLGGEQEAGRRSGTENTAAIVGMGVAAELAAKALAAGEMERIRRLRDQFEDHLLSKISGCTRNGDADRRLTNTSNLAFEGCDSDGLIILLDAFNVWASAGAACMTGKREASHVLKAMGLTEEAAKSCLRLSFSRLSTSEDGALAAKLLIKAVERLRSVQGGGVGPVAIFTK